MIASGTLVAATVARQFHTRILRLPYLPRRTDLVSVNRADKLLTRAFIFA